MKKQIVDVSTGQVKMGGEDVLLRASAIGSCVVVCVYNKGKEIGIMAHVMLSGSSPVKEVNEKTKYAKDAIEEMIIYMGGNTIDTADMEACLVGGANVLKREGDMIGQNNIDSVIGLLKERNIKVKAQSLGGTMRRSATFDVKEGCVFYTRGDEKEQLLCYLWRDRIK